MISWGTEEGQGGPGQWASSSVIPLLGDTGIPFASLSLGFLLGKVVLAVHRLRAAPFLEFSLMLTLLDTFTSSLLPAFAQLVSLLGASSPHVACLPLLILLILAETPFPLGSPWLPCTGLSCSAHSWSSPSQGVESVLLSTASPVPKTGPGT